MKTVIAILYTEDDWGLDKIERSESESASYALWGRICNDKGVSLIRVSVEWFKDGEFEKYWMQKDGDWVKVNEKVLPTVVHDKTRLYSTSTGESLANIHEKKLIIDAVVPILNSPEFSILLSNKLNQAVVFQKYLPKTRIVQAGTVIDNPNKDTIVLKNFWGSSGKQVIITDDEKITVKNKSIQQEFIDGSIDGELKDIRIAYIGREPQYVLQRHAKKGSLYTNYHKGATETYHDANDFPESLAFAEDLVNQLSVFPKKIFSLDFLISATDGKHYLMEINTMTGVDGFEDDRDSLVSYLANLTDYLLNNNT